MRDAHEPCRTVHLAAEIVAIAVFRLTSVDPDSHPQGLHVLIAFSRKFALHRDRRIQRLVRRPKHRVNPIARRLDHMAAVRRHRLPQDRVMTCQRALHRVGMLIPHPGRTLDIGEQEGDRPRRQLRHHPKCPIRATQAPWVSPRRPYTRREQHHPLSAALWRSVTRLNRRCLKRSIAREVHNHLPRTQLALDSP
jgi:hypothetical protein